MGTKKHFIRNLFGTECCRKHMFFLRCNVASIIKICDCFYLDITSFICKGLVNDKIINLPVPRHFVLIGQMTGDVRPDVGQ